MTESNRIYRYQEDRDFNILLQRVQGISVVDAPRLHVLHQMARHYSPGNIAEVGVYMGGSALVICKGAEGSIVDLFDTFEGMPKTDPVLDIHREGEFKASLEDVKMFLADCPNARFYPGFFPDSIAHTAEEDGARQYSFVHVDVDIYQSAKDCLHYFYPRMILGGTIVFDDYSFRSTPGVKTAIDEFLADKREKIIDINTGQGLLIKHA